MLQLSPTRTRVLCIDPGIKHIGLAISDPTECVASPYTILPHSSRMRDALKIVDIVNNEEIGKIVIGQSYADDGLPSLEGRRAKRLAEALRELTHIPIVFWDEAFSTIDARRVRLEAGAPRRKRARHLDDVAAALILQSYLDDQVIPK